MEKQGNNRGDFENLWQAALADQSVDPPRRVWVELDRALANAELITAKKQISVYKWSAAAAVLMGIALSAIAITSQFTIGLGEGPGQLVIEDRIPSAEETEAAGNFRGYGILNENTFRGQSSGQGFAGNDEVNNGESRQVALATPSDQQPSSYSRNLWDVNSIAWSPEFSNVDPIQQGRLVNKVPDYAYYTRPVEAKRDRSSSGNNKFWAGFDLSSGYYSPNYSQTSSNEAANILVQKNNSDGRRDEVPELSENMRGGASYSVGLNFGVELKENWTLESGVQYSLLGARTLTNLILESRTYNRAVAFSSEFSGLETFTDIVDDALTEVSVDDIDLNNTFQFISLPVQAGYLILDKKVNVKINGGIAANLYLGHKLTGSSGVGSFEIDPGTTSAYRELTFSGIAGLELGYRILDRVNITLEPNYQQSFQSLTKSSSNFSTNPSGVGVQAGMKYSF